MTGARSHGAVACLQRPADVPRRRQRLRASRSRVNGWTLVETAIVICVVGSLIAIFVPTFSARLRTSKIDEPPLVLAQLHEAVKAYYESSHGGHRHCLPESVGPVPVETRQEAEAVDFTGPHQPGRMTFEALGFETQRPLRYRYELWTRRAGCGVTLRPGHTLFTLRATGDLDGDGVLSSFERRATVDDNDRVVPAGILHIRRRME